MRLLLTGRQVEITPTLRRLVEARLAKLERRFGDALVSAQVVLSREKNRFVAEVVVHARQDHILHGIGTTQAWSTSLTARGQESAAAGRNGQRQVAGAEALGRIGAHAAACGVGRAPRSRKRA